MMQTPASAFRQFTLGSIQKSKYYKAYQITICRSASSTLPLLSSVGCWGSSTQVSTFSPVSWFTSVWKVRRGCDWFTDSHKALRRSVIREMGRFGSLKWKKKKSDTFLHFSFVWTRQRWGVRWHNISAAPPEIWLTLSYRAEIWGTIGRKWMLFKSL